MKVLLIALALAVVVGSSPTFLGHVTSQDLFSLWESWKLQHGKSYATAEEELHRYNIFIQNYKIIQQWNSEKHTSTMALNLFADLTREEFRNAYMGGTYTVHDEAEEMNLELSAPLPASWDWRTKRAVTPVKAQGACMADYAFAAIATLETMYVTSAFGFLTPFSEQQIVDCDQEDGQCKGGNAENAIDYAQVGVMTEDDYPYKGSKGKCAFDQSKAKNVTQGVLLPKSKNTTALKAAVITNPTAVIVEADEAVWQFYSGGTITANCSGHVNHWVTIVGYGNSTSDQQDAFYVKNSWGTSWGDKGYVYIGTDNSANNGVGVCGILTRPVYPFPYIGPMEDSAIEI